MSHFPPFPPNRPYSPSRAYGERPPFPPPLPPAAGRDFPPYPYPASAPPPPLPPSTYRPYDPYSAPPDPNRAAYPYAPPQRYDSEHYDPYQPASNAYDPGAPAMRPYSNPYPPASASASEPTRALPPRRASPPPRHHVAPPARFAPNAVDSGDLTLLTPPTTINIGGYTAAIHSLPPSHLPLTKLVSLNREDALDLHRQLCSKATSVWYCDGSSRAGEGWSAAIEWIIDSARSGAKMRGCVGQADSLDAELGGICKAVEGFQELLHQSIKDGKPMSHELLVFCESQAAIASIDTASRPEALRFEDLWRTICSEYLHANMTLVWLPRGSNLEGIVLADKIATVGASNSYLKKKKEGSLPDIYRRPGGGEPAPSGSSEAGAWQRGDADPSRRKSPFKRPLPPPLSPVMLPSLVPAERGQYSPEPNGLRLDLDSARGHGEMEQRAIEQQEPGEAEEEPLQPRPNSVFVTHFPEDTSARDLGILFSQYGNIVAVDIYHISPKHPRFAFVAYSDLVSCDKAISDLHRKAIDLNTPFNTHHRADLDVWATWAGQLTVVMAEPPRLVPASVMDDFPDLPDWAGGKGQRNVEADASGETGETIEADGQVKEEMQASPDGAGRKREREAEQQPLATLKVDSPSPHKRARQAEPGASPTMLPETTTDQIVKTEPGLETDADTAAAGFARPSPPQPGLDPPKIHLPQGDSNHFAGSSGHPHLPANQPVLPPTPNTAEHPATADNATFRKHSPARQGSVDPSSLGSVPRRPLTNSAAEPQEYPVKIGAKTLTVQLNLIRNSFGKVDRLNWIAHTCFIASDLDQARRALKDDLYATDSAFLTGRDLEQALSARGFTAARVDAFITKVLKVLDGIAAAEDLDGIEGAAGSPADNVEELEKQLDEELSKYTEQTREAVMSGSKVLEYLVRGKEAQERKRLEVERRVKVLEGMAKIGEVVGGVVRYLLTEDGRA